MHVHRRLEAGSRGEDLAALNRDRGIALDDLGVHVAHGLDAQRQRRHVQQQQALDLAGHHAALQRRAHGHALVRIDALEGLLAGEALHGLLHRRNAARTAHQQHLGEVLRRETGVGHRLLHRSHGHVHQMMGQLVKLRAGQHGLHVQRAVLVRRQEGQVDAGHGDAGELDLRLLRCLLDALHCGGILAQVDLVLPLKFIHQIVHDALVEVVAAQAVVARRGQNLDDVGVDVQNRYVEGAAAQVVDHDLLRLLLVHAVGQRRGGGLVDDALDVQSGDHARILGGLALRVGEVGGHGDHGLRDRLAQIGLRVRLQFLKDHRRDFLGRILLSIDVDAVVGAHLALDGADGALTVGDRLALGNLADQALSVLCKCDE